MKHLKLFETFNFSDGINPDILTREQFESLSRQSIHMRFSRETTVGLTMNVRKTDININYDSKVKQHIMFYFNYSYLDAKMVFNTKFSIMKIEGDEPFVYFDARYGYRNIGTDYWEYQKYPHDESIYGRMEVEEFDMIIKNPRLWKDWMVDKTFELDQQTHKILKESLFDVPEPELMDVNEWDEEVTNAKEVDFNQKEKELFISLSDTISVKNKRYMPEIGKSSLFFQMINGDINPKLKETTPIRNISTYKNDDEFYYVNIWGRDADDKVYRCDGYECWEKFLKEIFQGYRDLINNQTKTNESFGGYYYKEMGGSDYFRATNHRFTDSEIKELSNIAEQKGGEVQKYPGDLMATIKIPRDKGTVTMIEHTSVKKVEDEFYYVAFDIMNQKKYYEADQFDGLIKLLEDIL